MIELAIAIIGVMLSVLIPLTRYVYGRRRKLEAYYETIWRKSSKLEPRQVLGIRGGLGFDKYYYKRSIDELIRTKIESNQNVLIVGNPLSGKSRAIWQILTTLNKPHDIIIPRPVDINPEDFNIPFHFTFWRRTILILDDMNRFAEKRNFTHLLRKFLESGAIVVACCRSGPEYDRLCSRMEGGLLPIFGDPVRIPEIQKEDAARIADQAGKSLPLAFDGNIGSIFLQLDPMKERYRDSSEIEKGILRSIGRLRGAGISQAIYGEKGVFSIEHIKRVCESKEEIAMKHFEWVERLKELEKKGFIEIVEKGIRVEEAYYYDIVKTEPVSEQSLSDMIKTFSDDFGALLSIGFKSIQLGALSAGLWDYVQKSGNGTWDIKRISEYYGAAVTAFEEALRIQPSKQLIQKITPSTIYPAAVCYNLGIAYAMLAGTEPEKEVENCKKATESFKEAIRTSELQGIPRHRLKDFLSLNEYDLEELIGIFCEDKKNEKTDYIS